MGKRSYVALLGAAALLVACCGGKIYGVTPFGTPMFCALSGCFFIGFIAPIYLMCEFLFSFELWRLYTSGLVIFVMAVRWLLGLKLPRLNSVVARVLFALFTVLAHTVLSGLFVPIVDAVIGGFIGCLFYYFAYGMSALVKAEFRTRLGMVESAACCAVLFVAGLAFGRARYGQFIIGLAPAMLVVLLVGLVGTKSVLACGTCAAIGLGINTSPALIPAFMLCVLGVVAFSRFPRIVYSLTAIALFAAGAVLFYAEPLFVAWNVLIMLGGALLFCILPRRAVKKVRDYFDYDSSAHLALRHYINRCKADAANRMLAVASVFDETARLMSTLSAPPPDYAAIGEALRDRVCRYCSSYTTCDKARATAAFTALAERASGQKAILTDLPEFFTSSCRRVMDVISESAAITEDARERARERECEEKAKVIVTERLTSIKDVLEEMGNSEAAPVGFDGTAEKRIIDELISAGVDCADAFVTRDGVTCVVRTSTAVREKIRKAVGVCLKRDCELISLDKTQAAGWSVAVLKKRPMYDAVYARCGIAKDVVSGDSYTFERIDDRFLVALLDGMGSGSRAGESSGAAVELIECFYRAGFDSQSVISGVNRFLKLPTSENYSAADVVVCNLDNACLDIIKIGAPPCYIKTADTVLKIEGNSLPIGVLDEMRPFVTTKRLYPGQMLVLVSDGVSDCFSGDELPEFINGLSAFNPQSTVSAIIERARALSGGEPKDDMTAIAFRLFEKKNNKPFIIKN